MNHDRRWYPDLPGDWQESRVGWLVDLVNGYAFPSDGFGEEGYPLVRIRDLNESESEVRYSGKLIPEATIQHSDVLIGMDGDFNIGRWKGELPALLNQRVCLLRGEGYLTRYLEYVLPTPLKRINDLTYATTVKHLSSQQVLQTWIPIPSDNSTLRLIVDFLDRETAQIDATIGAQACLVTLLKARRAAAVDQAVTRGLDPSAELVQSGTPWIGQVPKNWSIQRIGNLGKSSIGLTYSPEDVVDDPDDGTLVLRAGNVRDGSIALEDTVYVRTPIPAALRLQRGDIVICARSGSANLVGKSAVVPASLKGHTWGAFMTVYRSPLNNYLRWVFASSIFRRQVGLFSTSTINQLTNATFHSMRIPVPPIAAQRDIVNYLDSTTIRIDSVIAKAQESIALMTERRSALISAAVTGRIDPLTGLEWVGREIEGVDV